MKKILITFLLLVSTILSFAQVPQGFNMQMVIRDAGGAPIPSEHVLLRYTLLQDSTTGTPVYQETQQKTSNQFGLINTVLGEGTVVLGDFDSIPWYNCNFYLKQELDVQNGNGYMDMGTTQLISVPYANVSGGLVLKSPNGIIHHLQVDDYGNLNLVSHTAPDAGFIGNLTTGIPPFSVAFTDTSTNNPISWQWDFGDGNSSTLQNPVHEYTTLGVYTVTLIVSNSYGTDSDVQVNYINVVDGIPCPGTPTVTDIDGNIYNTIQVDNHCWMKENLKVTRYPNGSNIPLINDNNLWANLGDNNTDDAYCYYNNDNNSEYGALYSYAAAIADNWQRDNTEAQGICPDGWHLPSDYEWSVLSDFLGGLSVAGGKMKEAGFNHWETPNTDATNESGFTALPGGYRNSTSGIFYNIENYGFWWTSSATYYRYLRYNSAELFRNSVNLSNGFSVSCLLDF